MALIQEPFGANNSIKFRDETTGIRIYDAAGDVVSFKTLTPEALDDTTLDATRYVTTVVEAGTGDTVTSASILPGNSLLITTAANEYDGINLQSRGQTFKLTAGKPMYFGAKLQIDDATQSDLLIGLAQLKTDLLKTSVAHGVLATAVEGIFFTKIDAVTAINASVYVAGVQTGTAASSVVMDTLTHIYEIYWDGITTLTYFVDGIAVGSFTANLCTTSLTPSLNFRNGSAAVRTCEVSWIRCFQANS